MSKTAPDLCSHCGAKMVEYPHSLNIPIVRALAKLYLYGDQVNLKELKLTRNEWDNFQKLKYWGLVFQVVIDGKRKKGVWWITKRGVSFLRGETEIPKKVWTYRGERIRYEGENVGVEGLLEKDWKERYEYAEEAIPHAGR